MHAKSLEECLPHNKPQKVFNIIVLTIVILIPMIFIIKVSDCLICPYVQINKYSVITQSMNKYTLKVILPKTLHISEKCRFEFRERIRSWMTVLRGTGLEADSLSRGRDLERMPGFHVQPASQLLSLARHARQLIVNVSEVEFPS